MNMKIRCMYLVLSIVARIEVEEWLGVSFAFLFMEFISSNQYENIECFPHFHTKYKKALTA